MRDLRRVLSVFQDMQHVTDEHVLQWLKENVYKIGGPNPIHVPQVPNYVSVEPASNLERPDGDTDFLREMETLQEFSDLELNDVKLIYDKCGKDIKKTSKVIQIMVITYNSDDDVLSNYDFYYEQLKHRLN